MSYQKRLKDFFKKNDPDRLYLAKQIARNFRQDEDAVFKRLEEIYQKGGPSKLVYKEITKSIEPSRPVHSSDTDQDNVNSESSVDVSVSKPAKSKKKLILISLIVLLLAVGGYFGFIMFTGDSSHVEPVKENEVHAEHSNDGSHHEVNAEKPQVSEEKTDSTSDDQTENDSTLNEIIEAAEVLEIIK